MNDIHIADRKSTKTMASDFEGDVLRKLNGDIHTPTFAGIMRFGQYLTTRVKRGPGKGRKRPKTIVYSWREF